MASRHPSLAEGEGGYCIGLGSNPIFVTVNRPLPAPSISTTSSSTQKLVDPAWSLPPSRGGDRRVPVYLVWAFWSGDNNRLVPLYRGFIQSEECLEHLLPGQLPLRKELELLNGEGKAALEDGDWKKAESSFLKCKSQLILATESLEKQVFGFLQAWVYTPLAQMYQFPDGADTMDSGSRIDFLRKAMSLREEMLDCILPLGDSTMIEACKSYLCTALYELGELTGSPADQRGAVQQYPGIDDFEEAEAHICVLLWCDHYFSGNLELGLAREEYLPCLSFDDPDWSAHGGFLGLIEADIGIPTSQAHFCMNPHLPKLPTPIQPILFMYVSKAKDACERRDWKDAVWCYQMFRTFLKISKRTVDSETYAWLLSWIDAGLADLYQYHVGKLEEAVELRKELKSCAKQLMPSEEDSIFWGYSLNLDLAEFECQQASGSGEHVEINQRGARCPYYAPFELYFWLYLHHHIRGNYKCSLRWLQEAKKLKEEASDHECPHSTAEKYFCCEYTLVRCEADLWMKLQATEEAIRSLKAMLTSKQCHAHQGSQTLGREAKQWLHKCEARPSALEDDEHEQEGVLDDSPSPTGCSCLFDGVYIRPHFQQEVIQSTTGLEHHLEKLPVPIQLAFRVHSDRGRSSMKFADWEGAIFNYEWCKELLRLTMRIHKFENKTYDWLVVWLDVPLVEVYEFWKSDFRRVLELRQEMWHKVPPDLLHIRHSVLHLKLITLYQCAVSYYPEVKNEVLKMVSKAFNFDTCLTAEEACLLIGRIGEAQALVQDFQRRTNKKKEDLTRRLQYVLAVYQSQDPQAGLGFGVVDQNVLTELHKLDQDTIDYLRLLPDSNLLLELERLRQEACELWDNNEWDKAVECYERVLENSKMARPEDQQDPSMSTRMTSGDYLNVGIMHSLIWSMRRSRGGETIRDFLKDPHFSRAVLYFELCNELPSHLREIRDMTYANYYLVQLYARVDDLFYHYLEDLTPGPFSVQVHGSGASSSSNEPATGAPLKAMRGYLAYENKMVHYGKMVSAYATSPLYTMTSRMSIEAWIQELEQVQDMYVQLRTYFFRKSHIAGVLRSWVQVKYNMDLTLLYTERERSRVMLYQVYTERGCSRVMLYQAEPDMLNYSASRKLWSFDIDDSVAAAAIRRDGVTLLQGDAVFVQYSHLKFGVILITVLDQKGSLSVKDTSWLCEVEEGVAQPKTVGDRLTRLYGLLDPRDTRKPVNHDRINREVNRILEFLYDVLIQPIRDKLAKMKPEQKLIISANEVEDLLSFKLDLSKVPFAALKDKRTGEFLIQRHTIAYTLSLRALKLRHWTARPYSDNIRQALVHIGSHAKASSYSIDPNQNVLHLACPYALFHDDPTPVTTERRSSEQGKEHLEQEADEYNHDEEVSNFDKEYEAAWDESRGEEVTDLKEKLAAVMRKLDYNTGQSFGGSSGNLLSEQYFTGTSRSGGESSTANDKPHDLKAEDIRNSDPRWKAELEVLSACSTSKGRITAVEGVLSLARAFLIAGVPCTVASLWKVDDNATADLMATFYEELSKGNDVATALRSTMLRGLSKYEVKDWAPFVVSGVPTLRIPHGLQRGA
ncbi:hypothetical protein R1sor_016111 [Riccia sorocarpa]|uniref:CHAT domain-containing protein n=1 Tax=Riccia sorocarpa TaxID=122646 RepID=A0ABD3HH96_9MARC